VVPAGYSRAEEEARVEEEARAEEAKCIVALQLFSIILIINKINIILNNWSQILYIYIYYI